jgi:hypothetical protein
MDFSPAKREKLDNNVLSMPMIERNPFKIIVLSQHVCQTFGFYFIAK